MSWLSHGRVSQDPDTSGKESVLVKSLEFPPEPPLLPVALCLVLGEMRVEEVRGEGGGEGSRRNSVPREEGALRERQGVMNEVTDGEVRSVRVP